MLEEPVLTEMDKPHVSCVCVCVCSCACGWLCICVCAFNTTATLNTLLSAGGSTAAREGRPKRWSYAPKRNSIYINALLTSQNTPFVVQEEALWHEKGGPRGGPQRQNGLVLGDAASRTIQHAMGGRGGYNAGVCVCLCVHIRRYVGT